MIKEKSLKLNYIYNLIYKIAIIIIPLIVTPYISRILDPEGIGKYSFLNSIYSYFGLFASLGFGYYAQREIAKYQDDKHKQSVVFWEIQLCKLIPIALVAVVYFVLVFCGVYGDNSALMLVFSIGFISTILDITFFYNGNEEFGLVALINVSTRVLGTILIFVFVKTQNDLILYAAINYGVTLLCNFLLIILSSNKIEKIKVSELKPLRHMKGTLKLFIPTIATSIYMVFDKTLIGLITGSDYENGIYEQSEKIVKTVMTFVTSLGTIMIPRNSHEVEKGNKEKVVQNINNSVHFVWLLGLPLMFGIIAVVDNFVPWFLGSNFYESADMMRMLSLLIIFIGINNVFGLQYLIPMKRDKEFTISVICGAVSNLVLNIPFIYFFGAYGAVVSTLLAEFIVDIVMYWFVRKDIRIGKLLKLMIKPLISSIIMSAVVYIVSLYLAPGILNTLILTAIGMVIYLTLIIVLKDKLAMDLMNSIKAKLIRSKKPENS